MNDSAQSRTLLLLPLIAMFTRVGLVSNLNVKDKSRFLHSAGQLAWRVVLPPSE